MPWRIPEEEIERVKRSTDLVALVQSRGVQLKKHGSKDFIGRCPFHDDHQTPNFIVTSDKGLWHCMACGWAGNAIQFVEQHDGISFRHAFEVLAQGGAAAFTATPVARQATVPKLPCPLDPEADDATLFGQVVAYYHERLMASPQARGYLASRGLDSGELIDRFQIGFADRTLGLRLPMRNRKEGQTLRTRLVHLGLWRESGHEHFNGCIVVPLHNEASQAVSLYGRRVHASTEARTDAPKHLYPPGPHKGLFNRQCLSQPEIILCEAVFDALTFYANGFQNVTCLFGTEGFTDELWEAILKHKVHRVRIAYDADEAGERAAQRDAERFRQHGIEVFRIKFPWGMDANQYACKVKVLADGQSANKSLALLKRDLGKLLLAVEQAQAELAQPQEQTSPVVTLSPEEREQALALLGDPKLLERILAGFEQCGLVGEATNKLVGYLAAVSRKLDEPLAVLIQSTSAVGKSSLMEAILAFVPEEERVKYSAMTGQSLYYLGDLELRHKVREFTGWGNTQLKLHLGRLEEMEYLLAHRGRRGQSFVYELIYDGQGKDGQPFLAFAQLLRDNPGMPFQRPKNFPDLVRRARLETGLSSHPAHPGGLSALAVALHQGQRPTAGLEHPARAPGHAQGLLPLAHQAKRAPPQPGQRA
jgi:DNA primase catalytic core